MPSSYTTLLGYVLPATGELNNTWGSTVNTSLTQLVEDSVAGVATASVASGDWTLSTTGGGVTNEARMAILIATGSPGTTRNIYAPKQSKAYFVINQTDSTLYIKGGPTSPTTGVSIGSGNGTVVAWDGSDFVSVGGVTGIVAVQNGGTGAATLAANNVLLGNGTSAVQTVAPSTSGNVLTSNGTTWSSSAPSYAGMTSQVFTSNGTFTIPTGITKVKVTVVGGGGGSGGASASFCAAGYSGGGGGGGAAIKYLTGLTPGNTLTVTVGAAGTAGSSSPGNGGTGGNSSVASGTQTITTVQGNGGVGSLANAPTGGAGGSSSGGDIAISGQPGRYALVSLYVGGQDGGSSYFGLGGTKAASSGSAVSGTGYGAGATGAYEGSTTIAGAAGTAGIVIFEW